MRTRPFLKYFLFRDGWLPWIDTFFLKTTNQTRSVLLFFLSKMAFSPNEHLFSCFSAFLSLSQFVENAFIYRGTPLHKPDEHVCKKNITN